MKKTPFSINKNLISVMLEFIKCGVGLGKEPKMSEYSKPDILKLFDPLHPNLICNEDENIEEKIYKTDKFIFHTLKKKDSGDLVLYNSFVDALKYIETADPRLIKILDLRGGQVIVAYESFLNDEDDVYFENFIVELIRLSTFMSSVSKFIEGTDSSIIHFLKDYIKTNLIIIHE